MSFTSFLCLIAPPKLLVHSLGFMIRYAIGYILLLGEVNGWALYLDKVSSSILQLGGVTGLLGLVGPQTMFSN